MEDFGSFANLESGSEEENIPLPKKRKLQADYVQTDQFESMEHAKLYCKSRGYKFRVKSKSAQGTKHFYICKFDDGCPSKAFILLPGKVLELA